MVVKTRIAELSCGEPRVRKCREPTHPRNFGCHVTFSPSFRPLHTVTNVKKNFFLFVWSLQPWFNLVKKVDVMVILATLPFTEKKQQQSRVFVG